MKRTFTVPLLILLGLGAVQAREWVERAYSLRAFVNRVPVDRTPIFYVSDYGSIANTMTNTFPAGAIIDGGNQVYYERLVVPTNNLTVRNLTVDGTVIVGGWSLVSGAVYRAMSTTTPYAMFEDGYSLASIVSTTQADAVSALTAGQYSYIGASNAIYLRTSDDGAPDTHVIRRTRRDWDALNGAILVSSKSGVTLNNVHVRYHEPNSVYPSSVVVTNSSSISLLSVTASNCLSGFMIRDSQSITLSGGGGVSNINRGLLLEGNLTNVFLLSNRWDRNGRVMFYNGLTNRYISDGDGIGIGGDGGNMSNLVIGSSLIYSNGPPDYDVSIYGSGIYVGTSNPMAISSLTVTNNYIYNSHLNGAYLDADIVIVKDNVFAWNSRTTSANKDPLLLSHHVNGTTLVSNNLFAYNECTNTAAAFYINNSVTTGSIICTNNAFYNNGGALSYIADFWTAVTMVGKTNITENYNTIQRVGAWDTIKAARNGATTYSISQLADWRTATGQGANDDWRTTGPGVNPTTLSFTFTP